MEGPMPVSGNPAPGLHLREPGLVLPKAPTRLGACVEASGTGWVLFLSSLLLYGIILTMNTANAFAEQPVSYHTIRVDDLDIFYREAEPMPFGKIGRLMKPKCEPIYYPLKRLVKGTSALLQIPSYIILIYGLTSIISLISRDRRTSN